MLVGLGPGRFSVMLRSMDRSDDPVVKCALLTIEIAEENDRSSASCDRWFPDITLPVRFGQVRTATRLWRVGP
jgi:hypothetical protein